MQWSEEQRARGREAAQLVASRIRSSVEFYDNSTQVAPDTHCTLTTS